jgi:septal ring-binding cell division protein DamX
LSLILVVVMALQGAASARECDENGKTLQRCEPVIAEAREKAGQEPIVELESELELEVAKSEPQPEATQPRPPAFTLDGYVLQIGAYRDETAAKAAAAQFNGARMFILPIRRGQEDWYVLLYDNYATRENAELAAQQFGRDYPRDSSWVRDASQLRKVLRIGPATAPSATAHPQE